MYACPWRSWNYCWRTRVPPGPVPACRAEWGQAGPGSRSCARAFPTVWVGRGCPVLHIIYVTICTDGVILVINLLWLRCVPLLILCSTAAHQRWPLPLHVSMIWFRPLILESESEFWLLAVEPSSLSLV